MTYISGLWSGVPSVKYETFESSSSQVIYDITEEELGLSEGQEAEVDLKKYTTFNQVSHSREFLSLILMLNYG